MKCDFLQRATHVVPLIAPQGAGAALKLSYLGDLPQTIFGLSSWHWKGSLGLVRFLHQLVVYTVHAIFEIKRWGWVVTSTMVHSPWSIHHQVVSVHLPA